VKKIVLVFVALAFLMALRPVFGTLVGDVNGDGKVNIEDVAIVSKHFGTTPSSPTWNPACDLDNNGKVDIADVAIVAQAFGQHV
jgi:Ca2+-binding EF-hand superfamily protein